MTNEELAVAMSSAPPARRVVCGICADTGVMQGEPLRKIVKGRSGISFTAEIGKPTPCRCSRKKM